MLLQEQHADSVQAERSSCMVLDLAWLFCCIVQLPRGDAAHAAVHLAVWLFNQVLVLLAYPTLALVTQPKCSFSLRGSGC